MSIYEELGVVPVVNAIGNRTLLGGNTPAAAVRAAMDESEEYYAFLDELSEKVGEKIAGLLGIEAAMVTSGAAAALVLGAAACMAGDDDGRIEQLPDTGGMPHQFIIQKHLRLKYERCMTIPGGVLVEVGDEDGTRPEHVEEAIGPDTAAIHTLAQIAPRPGTLPMEELVRIGRARGIPVIVDAAGSVYPTGLLSHFVKMGCDLVAYGAKYYGSVNTSGLLTGRGDLVKAAFKQSFVGFEASPLKTFGRPMKQDRQDIVAAYAALKVWLSMDHEERFAGYERRIAAVRGQLDGLEGISFPDPPEGDRSNLWIRVDAQKVGKTADDVVAELLAGNPRIWVRQDLEDGNHFNLAFLALPEGQEQIIVDRLKEIL